MSNTINKEFQMLQLAVESIMDSTLITTCRKRPHINARMIFSKILLDKGHTTTSIGKYLGKSHCTVVHYKQRFDGYIMNDKRLKESYEHAKAVYYGSFDPVYDMDKAQLKHEIFNLRNKVQKTEEKMEQIKKQYAWKAEFMGIQELLYQKVPKGHEKGVQQALNRYLNGIHY